MDLIEHLRRVPLFEGLSEFHLSRLASICEAREAVPGQRLSRQADLGATFFLIESGEAVVHYVNEQGIQRPVGMLHAGDAFGITSLFLGEPRDATVTAVTAMLLWTIQRPAFQALVRRYPDLERRLRIPEDVLAKLRAPRYPWLEPGEMVLYHTRRYGFFFLRSVFWTSLALLGYGGLLILLVRHGIMSAGFLVSLLPLGALYAISFTWHWFNWANDYFVATTRRVTHHGQVAFLYESRDEAPIDRVQTITVAYGPLGSLLRYGNLTIETAAKDLGKLLFDHIPYPDRMREAIFAQIARARATRRAAQRWLIRKELALHANLELGEQEPEFAEAGDAVGPLAIAGGETSTVRAGALIRLAQGIVALGILPWTRKVDATTITWRKHWIFLIQDLIIPSLLGFVTAVLTLLGFFGVPQALVQLIPYYPFLTLFVTILCVGWFWWESEDWGNDIYVLTTERIIDIHKRPLFFAEERREANLGMIQNVSLRVPGFWAAMLDYGDVLVQTAGSGEFTFTQVPNPHMVQREIFRRMESYRDQQRDVESARRRAEIAEWFSVYDELRTQEKEPGTGKVGIAGEGQGNEG